jgi:hypothetical protein
MNWEKLTPLLEKSIAEVVQIKDVDERLAMLIFNVSEKVEAAEKDACANVCADIGKDMTSMAQWGATQCESAIRARGQR